MARLSKKAQVALSSVQRKFENGDLSDIIKIARIARKEGDVMPSDKWSFSNRVLAYMQTGEFDCRGFRQWQKAGRQVKKGSAAAFILGPITVQVEEDGERVVKCVGFRGIAVFSVEDTEGDDIPKFDYTPAELPPLVDVTERLGIGVKWGPTALGSLGSSNCAGTDIKIGTEDTAVFFHELAHAAHAKIQGGLVGGQHSDQETVAEFTAAVLMELYGMGDRSGNAWQYIGGYNSDPVRAMVKALSTVEKVLELIEGEVN